MTEPELFVLSICYDKTAPGVKVFRVVSAHKTKRDINLAIQKFRQKLYNDWYAARGNNWNRGKFVKGEKFVPKHLWKITPLKFS